MTTADLTVYGRPVGSLWDRRIGGRYELVEITDTGGTGIYVTLQRVDGGHELAMSVHNLGRNFVCVPEKAEPAESRSAGDAFRSAAERVDAALDRMDSAPPAGVESADPSDEDERQHATLEEACAAAGVPVADAPAVPEPEAPTRTLVLGDRLGSTVPAVVLEYVEDVEPSAEASLGLATTRQLLTELTARIDVDGASGGGGLDYTTVAGRPEPIKPSDEVPLAAWEIDLLNREDERPVELVSPVDFGDLIRIEGEAYRVVDADGKAILEPEPAPAPLLPWEEHPDWLWRRKGSVPGREIYSSSDFCDEDTPDLWESVVPIPRDLIERFRQTAGLGEAIMRDKALLDAADGVTA